MTPTTTPSGQPSASDLNDQANNEIYSPEASDGGTDWPTKLVSGAIIIAAILFAYWVFR